MKRDGSTEEQIPKERVMAVYYCGLRLWSVTVSLTPIAMLPEHPPHTEKLLNSRGARKMLRRRDNLLACQTWKTQSNAVLRFPNN